MPFRRGYSRSAATARRMTTFNQRSRRRRQARIKQKRFVKRVVNTMKEKKNICTSDVLTATTAWSYAANFQNISEGDTSFSRDGFQINARYMKIRGYISNGDGTNIVRLAVFRNDRNATPSEMPSDINGCFGDLFHQKNKLRYDRRFSLVETHSGGTTQKLFTAYIPMRHLVEYGSASALYPTKGGYWVAALSDSGAAAHPTITYTVEFVYNEK